MKTMKRLFNKLTIALLSMAFYAVFTGLATELTILTGLVASAVIALTLEPVLIKGELKPKDFVKLIYLIEYLLYFAATVLKEHFKIAKVILSRKIHVNPIIVEVPFNLENDYGITLLASTVTNTPGTITLHVDKTGKVLYVHWLMAKTMNSSEVKREIVKEFEELIKKIFG